MKISNEISLNDKFRYGLPDRFTREELKDTMMILLQSYISSSFIDRGDPAKREDIALHVSAITHILESIDNYAAQLRHTDREESRLRRC